MKIARIKDRYLFHSRSRNSNKSHDYLIFKDNSSNEIRAIQLTHLYKKDRHRFMQVRNGLLKKMKFNHRDTPSGVKNYYFNKDINGNPINLNHPDVNLNVYRKIRISNKQKNDVIRFSNRPNV